MDKSWMTLPRVHHKYEDGVEMFLDFAFQHSSINDMILCPCIKCRNGVMRTKDEVREHLIIKGFIKGYTYWIAHGELYFTPEPLSNLNRASTSGVQAHDDMQGLVHDVFGVPSDADFMDGLSGDGVEIPTASAQKFYKLFDDLQQELYPGCKTFSTLSFIIRLLHLKCLGKWSNTHFDMLLDLLRETLPEGANLPKSFYEAEKLMKDLGLGYNKIDACPNDCTLYWGDRSEWKYCKTCQESRWVTSDGDPDGSKRKIPHKSLWHFPLKPRLQRLFMSRKTASSMRWHDEGRTKDGCLRHPADSPMWKTFDYQNLNFAKDSRNVRLGLAADGFNPFKNMRNKEIRKKKTLHHRTGKKSFAQLGVEMKEEQGHSPSRVVMFKKWYTDKSGNPRSDEVANAIIDMDERTARLSPGKSDKIAPNDIFAQVRGEERNGRVRMLGDGVAPSDLWDVIPSRNTIYRQSMEQKKAYEEMKNKCNETIELLNEERAQMAEFLASNNRQRANGSEHNLGGSTSTGRSFAPRTQALRVNAYVALKSVCDASKTVALGYIQSLDPENVVGGRTLGDKWCEVLVQVPVEPKERLIRPYDMFDNIEDVVGCPIAWPIALVVREEVWNEAHDTMAT